MDAFDKNASVKWSRGDFELDPTELNEWIKLFLKYGIEPDYKDFYYTDFREHIYYDHKTTTKAIEDKRKELQMQLGRLDEFKYLVNKKAFPEKYKEYLFGLLKSKDKKFYDIMNKECEFPRPSNLSVPVPLWDENEVCLDEKDLYCGFTMTQLVLCDSCKYYLNVIKEFKKID